MARTFKRDRRRDFNSDDDSNPSGLTFRWGLIVATAGLAGCHRRNDPSIDGLGWLVMGLFVVYILVIAYIDWMRKEMGYRVEPANYGSVVEPTKIEQKAESQKASEPQ